MRRVTEILGIVAALLVGAAQGGPTSYSGALAVAGGGGDGLLIADGPVWNSPATSLSWVVDNTTTPGRWHYAYTLTVPRGDISHLTIEASDADPGPAFTLANLFSPTSDPDGWIDHPIEIKLHAPGPGNPNMPQGVYGIKFEGDLDATLVAVSFDSDREPVWGDFYAKGGAVGGAFNTVYNAGLPDADPLDPPANGSVRDHLLVPDSTTIEIPAPGVLALGGLGVMLIGWLRRRESL